MRGKAYPGLWYAEVSARGRTGRWWDDEIEKRGFILI